MKPKGKLLLIGGAEDKGGDETPEMLGSNEESEHYEILKMLLPKNKERAIEVITTATKFPDDQKKRYLAALRKIGFKHIRFMNISSKDEARKPAFLKRIKQAHAVLFTGGDQFRISTIIGGTPLALAIKEKYYTNSDFIVAGTSSGAMVIPEIMIYEGGTEEALVDTDLKTTSGLGLLRCCIVDTHFIKRGRFGRLAHAVIINPIELGIGLGEDTALLIENGAEATCFGSGMVVILDGRNIRNTNITEAKRGTPIFVDNLTVHLLVKDCRFSLAERTLINPERTIKRQKTA